MSFLTWGALAIGLLVVAPLVAHLLRRSPPTELPFAPVALVPRSPAVSRRQRALEDRLLFGLRAAAVVLLAVLGATPLLRCSRLALARQGGASVALAIVLDDSLSMRAPCSGASPGSATRFERAHEAALELVDGLQAGDAVALVAAGEPARVLLGATTSLNAVREALEQMTQSDRATDLDGAVTQAAEVLRELPHVDKRVVLLSDLEGASESAEPLRAPEGAQLWAPLDALRGEAPNCAVVRADHVGTRVVVRAACSEARAEQAEAGAERPAAVTASSASGRGARRTIALHAGTSKLAELPFELDHGATELSFALPENGAALSSATVATGPAPAPPGTAASVASGTAAGSPPEAPPLWVRLGPGDAIAQDDVAPVVELSGELRVGVVADQAGSQVPTGGPPAVEQALAALGLGADLQWLPTVPEDAGALAPLRVLIVDDVPGFTPEERKRLASWIEEGGVLLLGLGPRAAAAPLGAGFSPMLPGLVRWVPWQQPGHATEPVDGGAASAPSASPHSSAGRGIDPARDSLFGPTAAGLAELKPAGRARLELPTGDGLSVRSVWSDGEPFVLEHRAGRGLSYVVTLPFGTELSDLALRPAFLLLLQQVVDTARAYGGSSRTEVGRRWSFEGYRSVRAWRIPEPGEGGPQEIALEAEGAERQLAPALLGRYRLELDDRRAERVAAVGEREVLARPRALPAGLAAAHLGGVSTQLDLSRHVALGLLLLLAAELLVRAVRARRHAT